MTSALPVSPDRSPIVEAENLSRFYGLILGLNNVTFRIHPGITGVVGPNGAGKTTLFRLLMGQIRPSSGSLRVLGGSPWADRAVRAQLAYCPENEAVPAGLRPLEWLRGLGMISGLSSHEAEARSHAALDRVKLAREHWPKRLTAMSKGMRQRVKLAQCLLHEPRLVILDEPMNGLDPMGREEFANVLRDLAARGTSVLISSHILHDLEALCREFILLRWGRMPRASNSTANAGGAAAAEWPEATTIRCAAPDQLARFLFEHHLLRGCDIDGPTRTLHVRWRDPVAFFGQFQHLLLASGVPIYEVCATSTTLERAIEPGVHA
jgi:ABC-2 type transport system ATP-binding protein